MKVTKNAENSTSSTPSHEFTISKTPKSDQNLALSLHVIDPLPLNTIYSSTKFSAKKCCDSVSSSSSSNHWRSSRITSNKYRSPVESNSRLDLIPLPSALHSPATTVLRRRSPRLISSVSDAKPVDFAVSESALKSKSLPEKRKASMVCELALKKCCLRKSPRLSGNSGSELLALPEVPRARKKEVGSRDGDLKAETEKRCLRSRVVEIRTKSKSDSVELPELKTPLVSKKINSGELSLSIVSGKCLRSRKVPPQVVENVTEKESALVKVHKPIAEGSKVSGVNVTAQKSREKRSRHVGSKAALIELPVEEDKQSPIKTKRSISDTKIDEKCLRSKKRAIPLFEIDSGETKYAVIELPVKEEHKQTPVKPKISVSDISSEEKCLRSRKIPVPVVGAESVETKSDEIEISVNEQNSKSVNTKASTEKPQKLKKQRVVAFFIGEPVPDDDAREKWGWRYELKGQRRKGQSWILNADEEDEIILNVECHYNQAKVDGCVFSIGDCAFIKGSGKEKHVGRILEFFRTTEGEDFFRVQWFYKAEDTVMKDMASFHDKKRLFCSTIMNDNLLDCIVSKVNVIEIERGLGLQADSIQPSDFYYDMEYCVEYSTFRNLMTDNSVLSRDLSSLNYTDTFRTTASTPSLEELSFCGPHKAELSLLDLFSGCGGMSTGLCLGAKLSSVNLVTRWAVDYSKAACDSLKLNHPETQIRNMPAEDFLELLMGWEKLCKLYALDDFEKLQSRPEKIDKSPPDAKMPKGEFEVSHLVDISYGTIGKSGKHGLKFKVRWKGYDSSEDTWEPIEGLSNCQYHMRDFIRSGWESKILPVPGDVDVICGGPPCQGISGYNRYRNLVAPLTDERNRQIIVFMDIVKFLKPKYVLLENVTDILRFDKASLGRYALSRMVHMKYQARLGIMAAGCYGIPQFRLRVFLWGALPSEKLPQFPLPTHDVVVRYWPPPEFEQNTVAYDEGQPRELEDAVLLRDAISDLPAVTSREIREEMTYEVRPETDFQKYIRLTKHEITGFASGDGSESECSVLYDHRPYQLSEDDYLRVCLIPRRKGANFRDFPGVVVERDNTVIRDPTKEPVMLPSGKPLVPDYVFTFEKGKSKRPFARLWWDETVPTVVTFPCCHNQAALHPEQDRVLTLREYARLQGFPDFYRFCGTVKERYCQVGNAVAVPVAKALGYTLGMAFRKLSGDGPLMTLPPKFSSQVPAKSENFVAEDCRVSFFL